MNNNNYIVRHRPANYTQCTYMYITYANSYRQLQQITQIDVLQVLLARLDIQYQNQIYTLHIRTIYCSIQYMAYESL